MTQQLSAKEIDHDAVSGNPNTSRHCFSADHRRCEKAAPPPESKKPLGQQELLIGLIPGRTCFASVNVIRC
jgi:hypothetical protein